MNIYEKQLRSLLKERREMVKVMVIEPPALSRVIGDKEEAIVRVITDMSPPHGYIFPNIRKSYFKRVKKAYQNEY